MKNIIKPNNLPDFGGVIIAITYSQRVIIIFSMIIFFIVILFISFADYTQKRIIPGVVFPDKGIVSIKSRQSGILSAIYKKNGEHVTCGDKLLTIDASSSTHFFINNEKKYLQIISRLKEINNKESQDNIKTLRSKIQSTERQIAKTRNNIINMRSQIELLDLMIKELEESFNKAQSAYKRKYVSEIEMSNMEINLLEKKMQRQSLYNEMTSTEENIINLNDELNDYTNRVKNIQRENEKDNAQLLMQMYGISSETESVLRTPVSGDVAEFSKNIGNYVNAGETILKIIPQGSINHIVAFISPAFIGEIKKGATVILKYNSYPYQQFGVEHGIISDISKLPLQPEEVYTTFGLKTEKESFLITIKITSHQKEISIIPGMSLEIEVPTKKAPIIQWIFPFIKNRNTVI